MSAKLIYDSAPLGSIIRFSNGEPRPPERFTRKVAAWENDNGSGRLVECSPPYEAGSYRAPASFTLQTGRYGSHGVVVLVVRRVWSVAGPLHFEIAERPKPGMVRVLTCFQGRDELRHLADDMVSARAWLAEHGHPGARFDVVGAEDGPDRKGD
jgi:hypothetical protein